MKSKKLYQQLEKDFIKSKMKDDWTQYMQKVSDFLSDNFKARSMGLYTSSFSLRKCKCGRV